MTRKAGETGPGAMGLVALEQIKFPEGRRILDDDLAYNILPFGMRAAIRLKAGPFPGDFIVRQAEKKVPGLWGSIMCRKRYIDDKLSESVQSGEVEAVVNLGAGYDTRALRLPALTRVKVMEVDQPETIRIKRSRITKLFGRIPVHLTLAAADFDREDLRAVLDQLGHSNVTRTFFILEGVTQYLTEAGLQSTFDFLAGAPTGSRLVFTYILKDFIEGRALNGHEFLYSKMVATDGMWLSGLNPEDVDGFLDGYGWRALEHLGYEELTERYIEPAGRKLKTMPVERMVYAVKR